MTDFAKVGTEQFAALILGVLICVAVPIVIAIVWIVRKKEPVTTVLVGAAAFLLFAVILEKPIQNALILPDHAVSRFINARPFLFAFVVGLFPGVFEETGRLVAFRTLLRKRKNRETSISYGIGHGGFEVILILGVAYIQYITYAIMINSGTFGTVVEQVAQQAPAQVDSVYAVASQIAGFSFSDLGMSIFERVFAVLFHIGASILVFYACRDRKRFWLYPLAIVLHTAMDFIAALYLTKTVSISAWTLEAITAAFGLLTFFGAYLLLYRRDRADGLT